MRFALIKAIFKQFSLWFLYDVDYYYYSYITRSIETYISLLTQREKKNKSKKRRRKSDRENEGRKRRRNNSCLTYYRSRAFKKKDKGKKNMRIHNNHDRLLIHRTS